MLPERFSSGNKSHVWSLLNVVCSLMEEQGNAMTAIPRSLITCIHICLYTHLKNVIKSIGFLSLSVLVIHTV